MTIAQRFVEMAEQMGMDMSDCHSGNVSDVLNTMTLKQGGTVSNTGVIGTAMMNFTNALEAEKTEDENGPNLNDTGIDDWNTDDNTTGDEESET